MASETEYEWRPPKWDDLEGSFRAKIPWYNPKTLRPASVEMLVLGVNEELVQGKKTPVKKLRVQTPSGGEAVVSTTKATMKKQVFEVWMPREGRRII